MPRTRKRKIEEEIPVKAKKADVNVKSNYKAKRKVQEENNSPEAKKSGSFVNKSKRTKPTKCISRGKDIKIGNEVVMCNKIKEELSDSECRENSFNSFDSINIKSNTKRKIQNKNCSSEAKGIRPSNKKAPKIKSVKCSSSQNKDVKVGNEKVELNKLKKKSSDSEYEQNSLNSSDSGIVFETLNIKAENGSNFLTEVNIKTETPSCSKVLENVKNDESSSSDSEWEEVEEHCEQNLDDYKPEIPKEGVEITIDCPDLHIRKRKKKQFDEMEYIRLYINRTRKDAQLCVHKVHLLCLLAHGFYINNILNSSILKGISLSLIPNDILTLTSGKKVDKIDVDGIEKIVSWFRDSFSFETTRDVFFNFSKSIVESFENQKTTNASEYNLMFIVIARTLGFKARFCVSLYPVTYKAHNLIKKPNIKTKVKSEDKTNEPKKNKFPQKCSVSDINCDKVKSKQPKIKKCSKEEKEKTNKVKQKPETVKRPRRSAGKSYKISSDESDDEKDKDFECKDLSSDDDGNVKSKKDPSISKNTPRRKSEKKANRKVLSTDSEPSSPEHHSFDPDKIICWAEIFSKQEKQWVSVECVNNVVNKPYDIEALAPNPVTYILAFDNDSHVKDVTRRYCNEYMTSTIKLRVDPDWWEESLEPFLPPNSKLDKEEERKLDMMLVNKPLPHTVAGFKNHPLYALKRHLLKFEAIYPPDAPPVGFMRGEPIYARDCVHQLHSRETWLKEARVVRIGEEPYKIVKARPKWDKIAGVLRTDLPLEIFGYWQTEQYEPPIAVNGKVPRNEYGNVELFKPCMLPKGTVHLQNPGLNRIARKLGIDCSPAVVGFDGHKGSIHPVFDGFIICEEYKDTILAAWEEEQENAIKREEEKREKRIYGNWKKLIRGLLIRERIKLKYDVK